MLDKILVRQAGFFLLTPKLYLWIEHSLLTQLYHAEFEFLSIAERQSIYIQILNHSSWSVPVHWTGKSAPDGRGIQRSTADLNEDIASAQREVLIWRHRLSLHVPTVTCRGIWKTRTTEFLRWTVENRTLLNYLGMTKKKTESIVQEHRYFLRASRKAKRSLLSRYHSFNP